MPRTEHALHDLTVHVEHTLERGCPGDYDTPASETTVGIEYVWLVNEDVSPPIAVDLLPGLPDDTVEALRDEILEDAAYDYSVDEPDIDDYE